MSDRQKDLEEFNKIFPYIRSYQEIACKYKINDIFQDNGGKYLQIFLTLNLYTDGSREGNDAFDSEGNEYEIKTLNVNLQRSFSTHHHLNLGIIEKYRGVRWFFCLFENIEMKAIYLLKPEDLEFYFSKWESEIRISGKEKNNPKIPLKYVMSHGELVWLPEGETEVSFSPIVKDPNRVIHKRKSKKKT